MTLMPNANTRQYTNNAFSDEHTMTLNMPMSIDNNAIYNTCNANDNNTMNINICHNNNYRNSDINYDNMELSSVPNMN